MLWAKTVFSVDGTVYTWEDVAAFARGVGEWGLLRSGPAASGSVDEAARRFRYERRLLTAEETEAWLASRGITVAEWMGYIRRSVGQGEDVAADDWVDGWCSGRFEQWARQLAERVAAQARIGGELDDVLERFEAEVVTPDAVAAVIERRRLDWLRVDVEEAVFDTEGAAREAALSVRADGVALAEAAAVAGVAVSSGYSRLAEVLPEVRRLLLGAQEGDVVEPFSLQGRWVVSVVLAKTMPTVEDNEVLHMARREVVATALRREVEARVRLA